MVVALPTIHRTPTEHKLSKRRKRQGPKKPRRKGVAALGDLAAWGYSDDEILDAAREWWHAPVYGHYRVRVVRVMDESQTPPAPIEIQFEFSCIHNNPEHEPSTRGRMKTGDGTTSLIRKADDCDLQRLGVVTREFGDITLNSDKQLYSGAHHRAILAIWSAASHRSFESLVDKFHQMEVSYLRPGTTLPSAMTISRDVKAVHGKYASRIREYFQTITGAIHLAIDGWTSPISESYLGIVVIWYNKPKMYRCILEFIRLTSSHTGEYLAECIAACLQRYGLENKILAACLDNASNNLTLTRHLQRHIPHFHGERSYVRCLAHIINLMAKAFLLPFSRPTGRTQLVLMQSKQGSQRLIPTVQEFLQTQQETKGDNDDLDDVEGSESDTMDPSQFEHDTLVAQESVLKAIEQVYASENMAPTGSELRDAQAIMSTVSGLARRVNDSPQLKLKLQEVISMFPELRDSNRKSLPRRVPTRWDTDRVALDGYIHLSRPVRWLTSEPSLNLQQFSLKETLWPLAEELNEALEVFEVLTKHFSLGEVPLIYQVLPAFVDLKNTLSFMRSATKINPVTRVAAQAALNVFDKYMANMTISEVYFIAIAMCPDIKLNWFRRHFSPESVEMIRQMILARFSISYPSSSAARSKESTKADETKPSNRWLREVPFSSLNLHMSASDPDSIETYLATDTESVSAYGGVLPYWSAMLESKPRLARIALDYLTAPATSVDVERAFSAGRLTINHLQHNMSPSTFEAKMALGSWYDTPLLPDLAEVASVIEAGM